MVMIVEVLKIVIIIVQALLKDTLDAVMVVAAQAVSIVLHNVTETADIQGVQMGVDVQEVYVILVVDQSVMVMGIVPVIHAYIQEHSYHVVRAPTVVCGKIITVAVVVVVVLHTTLILDQAAAQGVVRAGT